MIANQLKPGNRIIWHKLSGLDNRQWTIDEIRPALCGRLVLLCHSGMSNQRFYVKPEDPVRTV